MVLEGQARQEAQVMEEVQARQEGQAGQAHHRSAWEHQGWCWRF